MSAESSARVFFALWPGPGLIKPLAAVAGDLAHRFGGRATRSETLHLTLAFLAKVPEARLPELSRLGQDVSVPPFALMLDTLGVWPRQQLAWAGCTAAPAALGELACCLQTRLLEAGFAVDRKPGQIFRPHVTLVRKLPGPVDRLPEIEPLSWPVQRFLLVRSVLSAEGPAYRQLGEFSLRQR